MLYYDIINLSKGTEISKSNNKECIISHHWFFNHGFKFQDPVCSGGHGCRVCCYYWWH